VNNISCINNSSLAIHSVGQLGRFSVVLGFRICSHMTTNMLAN